MERRPGTWHILGSVPGMANNQQNPHIPQPAVQHSVPPNRQASQSAFHHQLHPNTLNVQSTVQHPLLPNPHSSQVAVPHQANRYNPQSSFQRQPLPNTQHQTAQGYPNAEPKLIPDLLAPLPAGVPVTKPKCPCQYHAMTVEGKMLSDQHNCPYRRYQPAPMALHKCAEPVPTPLETVKKRQQALRHQVQFLLLNPEPYNVNPISLTGEFNRLEREYQHVITAMPREVIRSLGRDEAYFSDVLQKQAAFFAKYSLTFPC